jgi:hypothetical protein
LRDILTLDISAVGHKDIRLFYDSAAVNIQKSSSCRFSDFGAPKQFVQQTTSVLTVAGTHTRGHIVERHPDILVHQLGQWMRRAQSNNILRPHGSMSPKDHRLPDFVLKCYL